jgi:hypothetical protein
MPKHATQGRHCSTCHLLQLADMSRAWLHKWKPPSPFFHTTRPPSPQPQPPAPSPSLPHHLPPLRMAQGAAPPPPWPHVAPATPPCCSRGGGKEEEDLRESMTNGPMCFCAENVSFLCCVKKFISRVLELLKS